MNNRELCLRGDTAQTYNMPYVFKAQQAENVWDYYGHHRIIRDSLNKRTLNKINPADIVGIFH